MKLLILTLILFSSLNCLAQILEKSDTLIIRERITLLLDNSGFAIPPFAVSGTLYFTNCQMIFHPKPFRRKRVEMYNDLVKDIIIPYDSITVAKKASIDGLKIKTKTRKYKFAGWRIKPRAIITLINRLKKERAIR